jgi:hypothetical protein
MRTIRRLSLAIALLAVCAADRAVAAEAMSIRSADGHFVLRLMGLERFEPTNRLRGFDLRLETADGRPATGASITLSGRRFDAPNPLPTLPRITPATGEGHYRVEGLRFHMPGDWHLVFAIDFAQIHDRAALDIVVK